MISRKIILALPLLIILQACSDPATDAAKYREAVRNSDCKLSVEVKDSFVRLAPLTSSKEKLLHTISQYEKGSVLPNWKLTKYGNDWSTTLLDAKKPVLKCIVFKKGKPISGLKKSFFEYVESVEEEVGETTRFVDYTFTGVEIVNTEDRPIFVIFKHENNEFAEIIDPKSTFRIPSYFSGYDPQVLNQSRIETYELLIE
ncbi:MAG: hypothetical protein ACRCXZ_08580 [Patescibacteria group bacterium]